MTGMSLYEDIISEATGVTDSQLLAELEDIMRHDIFHSTLDWQTREELAAAACQALEVAKLLNPDITV